MPNKKIQNCGELAWLCGIVLCSLGLCLSARSGLGVSMIVAPAYNIYLKVSQYLPWFTLGMAQYMFQGLLIIATSLAVHRFKLKYLLCFLTAVIHGVAVDLWRLVIGSGVAETLTMKIFFCASGAIATSIAVALMLRTYLPQEVYELFVKEVADKYSFSVNKTKWVFDISSLVLGIVLMLVLFKEFSTQIIGVGTIVLTFLNTPLITLFGRIFDKFVSFKPRFKSFYETFERIMD